MSTGSGNTSSPARVFAGTSMLWPAAVVLVAILFLFLETRHYGLLGFDAYPIIETSRVASPADFTGNFTERLMDGRYLGPPPHTSAFYRPLVNWTFAIDHALWGLNPAGYQWTGVLWLGACALALYALMRRLAGSGSRFAAWIALIAFLVHPMLFEVLPAPARRAELLCLAFMLLSLFTQLSPRALGGKRLPLLPAVFTLLAIASKETAFVLPLFSFVVVYVYSAGREGKQRLRQAARATVPHAAAAAFMLLARFAVIGGLGGHGSMDAGRLLGAVPQVLSFVVDGLVLPQAVMHASLFGRALLVLLAVGILALGFARGFGLAADEPDLADVRLLDTAFVALLWITVFGLVHASASWVVNWYVMIPVAGWAMLVGAGFEGFLRTARGETGRARSLAATVVVLLVLLLLWQARYSPLFHRYEEWARGTAASEAFLEETAGRIEGTNAGETVIAPALPLWVRMPGNHATLRGVALLSDYSVQAWADLAFPERRVRVALADAHPPPPDPDEVLLLLAERTVIEGP